MYKKGWIVHAKKPFSKAEIVIEYLSRYLKKIAIGNNRIVKVENKKVSFKWKDNRDGKEKYMTISADEFIRRYLLHVLPDRYVKIRYYGFMSNSIRKEKIEKCRELLKYLIPKSTTIKELESDIQSESNKDHIKNKCPFCKRGTLMVVKKIHSHRAIP